MHSKRCKIIDVRYIPSNHIISVLPSNLRINYNVEYIRSLTGLDNKNCRKVLYWLGETYDENKGININVITGITEGVKAGLL
jgi:hypothetical protein